MNTRNHRSLGPILEADCCHTLALKEAEKGSDIFSFFCEGWAHMDRIVRWGFSRIQEGDSDAAQSKRIINVHYMFEYTNRSVQQEIIQK